MANQRSLKCAMAITEQYDQHTLTLDSIPETMALVEEAGWNQVEADWRLMCSLGDAAIIRDTGKTLVASALSLPYPAGFGWVSMVLVSLAHRRKGLATRLLKDRIDWLMQRDCVPLLDATEQGEPVYAALGFKRGDTITRWQGVGAGGPLSGGRIAEAGAQDHARIRELDSAIFSAERSVLIDDFLNRPNSSCLVLGEKSFVITRRGRRATQFGPLVATTQEDAIALLDAALATVEGPVFFDLFDKRTELAAYVAARGFEKQRGFVRMSLGAMPDFDGNGRAMIIAGPEYG